MDPENIGTEAIVRVTHWLRGIWEMRRQAGPVQQWVDSIPSFGNQSSNSFDQQPEVPTDKAAPDIQESRNSPKDIIYLKQKLQKKPDMTASAPISIPSSPAITMTGPVSSVPHSRLARDPSFQSDSSHCSSVESLLEWRKADPEAILLGLGFGYPSSPQENGSTARIPKRFLQPSKLKGIAINDYLKQQQESSESLDSASLGYRGLTGSPYVAPSEIVQKIMERLREHETHEVDLFNYSSSNSELFGPMQQDGRLSVLSPDNRQYLERPRSKSPDMRNKRMIIGKKSFAFGNNGDLIEVKSIDKEESNFESNETNHRFNENDPDNKLSSEIDKPKKISHYDENIAQNNNTTNEKLGKTSGRKLTKQLSFDADNTIYSSGDASHKRDRENEERLSIDERFCVEQRDSLVTVISRWSDSVETPTDTTRSFDDTSSTPNYRRASDGVCDVRLNESFGPPKEDRRLSDTVIHTKSERLYDGSWSINRRRIEGADKKPGLRRQARVSDVDLGECGIAGISVLPSKNPEKDQVLCSERDNDIELNISDETSLESEIFQQSPDPEAQYSNVRKNLCCHEEKHKCCKNDELDLICEHESSSTDCCCHANTKCWRKMSEIMREKKKLEDIVAKNKQEMAELRERLNNVMPVGIEQGF
ncbi:uncharacterized protein LOC105684324 isoform X1 [Athalia rosae]|uniref:uncharacterized protein LOC105684324 isoform X1 n=2 Tax=Athalia rosae TaxID=37344 RepID=UPI002033885A|nr:uncharacterized protein LOC105684324 isoform X1 [Athalia rosae]